MMGVSILERMLKDLSIITSLLGLGPLGRRVYSQASASTTFGGLGFSNIGKVAIENHHGLFTIEALGFVASLSSIGNLSAFAASIYQQAPDFTLGQDS
jgi:hypothetical protein